MGSRSKVIAITVGVIAIVLGAWLLLRNRGEPRQVEDAGIQAETPEVRQDIKKVIAYIKTREEEFSLCEIQTTGSSWNRALEEIYKVDKETSEQTKLCDKSDFIMVQDGRYEQLQDLIPDKRIEIYSEMYWDPTLKEVTNEINYLPEGTKVYELTDRESVKFIRGQIGNGAELLEFMQYGTEEWPVVWEAILVNNDKTQLQRFSYRRTKIEDNGRLMVYETDRVGSFLGKLGIIQKSGYQL